MFSRFITLLPFAALAAVVAAAPNLEARTGACNTGSDYCCNQKFNNPADFAGILGGLLTAVVGANVQAGFTCNPISVVGVGSAADCTVQGACCSNNNQIGLVNVECVPIAVSA